MGRLAADTEGEGMELGTGGGARRLGGNIPGRAAPAPGNEGGRRLDGSPGMPGSGG